MKDNFICVHSVVVTLFCKGTHSEYRLELEKNTVSNPEIYFFIL